MSIVACAGRGAVATAGSERVLAVVFLLVALDAVPAVMDAVS